MDVNATRGVTKRRRERATQPPLTRQGVIDAALAILHNEGLDKVTMRRIAAALDTGAASLYVYVRDTKDLHAQLLDALLGTVAISSPAGGAWRERLKALLTSYALVLFQYPAIARMTMTTHPSGPHYLALVDTVLALLRKGGVADREAVWTVDVLLLFATATAAEHGAHKEAQEVDEFSALARAIHTADAGLYPEIARLGDELLSGQGPDRFQWGLDVLLSGVLTTRRPSTDEEIL